MPALIAAAAVAAAALAAPAAKDPSTMVLRKADFPAGADYEADTGDGVGVDDALDAKGIDADAASYLGVSYSKKKGAVQVTGAIYAAANAATAKKAFAVVKTERDRFWKTLGDAKPTPTARYGDQQFARLGPAGGEGIWTYELVVRKNTVVWLLNIHLERRPPAPRSEFLSDVKRFALKQKARVGSG